jgi:homoserine O-succinyltransferase/O-acetyltransferase
MSIALPRGLPARRTLVAEGVEVLSGDELRRWGRRPLRLCLVNLMPNKIVTETQIARLLGATSMMVELTLCVPDSYRSKTAPADYMASFYRPWTHVRDEHFDGLIVTGAPVETLPFEQVTYWSDLCAIFDWARSHTISSLYICWAAQAALYHFHGVPKQRLPEKMFGIFRHRVTNNDSHLLRGFGDEFPAPVSRHTEVRAADLPARAGLTVLAVSADAGLCVVEDRGNRAAYMFNHLEYDTGTLGEEFVRDRLAGKPTGIPCDYFPDNDPERSPVNVWRAHGYLLFANWLAGMHRTAWPRTSDEPLIQWVLAAPRALCSDADDHSDLLIAAAHSGDMLPSAVRTLADVGIAPRAVKAHRRLGLEQLIEVRIGRLEEAALEKVARRLGELPAAIKVAFRSRSGVGGWLAGKGSVAAVSEAQRSSDRLVVGRISKPLNQ